MPKRKANKQDATLINVRAANKKLSADQKTLKDHEERLTVIETLIIDAGLFPRKQKKRR